MKIFLTCFLLLVAGVLPCFPAEPASGSDTPLVFYTGVQSPIIDILHGRLREACRRIDRICEVRRAVSAERALLLANGEGDGDAVRTANIKDLAPGRTDHLVQVPESIYHVELYVYTWRENLEITGFASFAGLKNGVRCGVKVMEQKIPGEKVLLPDSSRLFRMLVEKRLDTVSEHGDIGDFIIQQKRYKHLFKRDSPLVSFPGYVFLHEKHRRLIPELAASIASMKDDGSFLSIKDEMLEKLLGTSF